jgi:DNA-binding GntR family transcriptional regulator
MPIRTSDAAPIRKEVLRDKIAAVIRGWILDGTLKPGERVVELEVAAKLKVSRAPIREALWLLSRQGLVQISAHRGATVTQLSAQDIRDIFEIREALETLAAKRIRASDAPDRAARLQEALGDMEQAARTKDMSRFSEADLRFHRTLWDLAGNRHLGDVLGELSTRFFGYELIRDLPKAGAFPFEAMLAEHRAMVRLALEGTDRDIDAGYRKAFRTFLDDVLLRFGELPA